MFVLWEWEWTETDSPDALKTEDSTSDKENDDGVEEESKPECEKSDDEEESVAESEIPYEHTQLHLSALEQLGVRTHYVKCVTESQKVLLY